MKFLKWIKKDKTTKYEILLISNGSTDKTRKKIREYERKFSFIKSFHITTKSRGKALKLAINKSRYNLIALCAIDNAWDLLLIFFYKEFLPLENFLFDNVELLDQMLALSVDFLQASLS